MSHETPHPEREGLPEQGRIFDVDSMSDGQIYTMRYNLLHIGAINLGEEEFNGFIDSLHGRLMSAVSDLARRKPERVRNMVHAYIESGDESRQWFAAEITPALLDQDYEFTRDTLIALAAAQMGNHFGDYGQEAAEEQAEILMRDRLTPEQIAEWQQCYAQFDQERSLKPALSDDRLHRAPWPPN